MSEFNAQRTALKAALALTTPVLRAISGGQPI